MLHKLTQQRQQQLDHAIASYRQHPRPEPLLQRISAITDACLVQLATHIALPTQAALIAIGGYGRQELYPHSDIDILILLATPPSQTQAQHLEAFIAALWDVGLKAATSVRTITQCVEAADQEVATQTAQLEARLISGNATLFTQLQHVLQQQLDVPRYFQAKYAEQRRRHSKYHNTPYALEPNCKESPGGLRDLHVLRWLAHAMGLGSTWQQIAQAEQLSQAELRAIRRANHAFMRLRIELHLLTGRAEDRVLFDYQPELAAIYGIQAVSKQHASEQLMQRYYWAARVVYQMNTLLLRSLEEVLFSPTPALCRPIDTHFEIRNQRLHLRDPSLLKQQPALILKSFLLLQQRPDISTLSAQTLRALWHARRYIDQAFRDQPEHQQLFLQVLQQPRGVVTTLRQMNLLGILPRYIPEFKPIVGQMQHDLFHVYTVDQHTLMVIHNLRRFTLAEYSDDHPLASQLMDAFERPWVLYVAALFHDIAKGRGGDHAQLGASDAHAFCQRHQLCHADTDLVVFLVTDHLNMSIVAQKRDLSDPKVISDFIQTIPSPRHLTALYLLTIADIKGTNPSIWNSWKAKLLASLYQRSLYALQGDTPEPSTILAQRKSLALSQLLAQGIAQHDIDSLWSVLDISYFLRHECDEIVWHSQALHKALLHPKPVIDIRSVGKGETIQLMVYTPDRDDLFMHICAFFDEHQLNTQDARIYTTTHGWALDSFVLLLPPQQCYCAHYTNAITHALAHYLQHPQPHPQQHPSFSAEQGNRYLTSRAARRARVFPLVPTVDIQPMSDANKWKIAIQCADRRGLLYSIAHVLTVKQIQLKSAKIMTLGERVEDTFIVHSDALHHSAYLKEVERALYTII